MFASGSGAHFVWIPKLPMEELINRSPLLFSVMSCSILMHRNATVGMLRIYLFRSLIMSLVLCLFASFDVPSLQAVFQPNWHNCATCSTSPYRLIGSMVRSTAISAYQRNFKWSHHGYVLHGKHGKEFNHTVPQEFENVEPIIVCSSMTDCPGQR